MNAGEAVRNGRAGTIVGDAQVVEGEASAGEIHHVLAVREIGNGVIAPVSIEDEGIGVFLAGEIGRASCRERV